MAELKIDITKLVGRCCEMVMDETEYAGKTLREWISDITNGDYAKHGCWRQVGREYKCSVCGTDAGLNCYREHRMTTKYCQNCGAKMDGDET